MRINQMHFQEINLEETHIRLTSDLANHDLKRYIYRIRSDLKKYILKNPDFRLSLEPVKIADDDLRNTYEALSLIDVLQKQNEASEDMQSGFIWVLNTCLFFVVDYRFSLIEPSKRSAQIYT